MAVGNGNRHINGLVVQGITAGEKSSVDFSGVKIDEIQDHSLNYHTMQFQSDYHIKNMDNVKYDYFSGTNNLAMNLLNCGTATIDDVDWVGIEFEFTGAAGEESITTNCDPGMAIAVEELPSVQGAAKEIDPFSKYVWY